MITCLKTTPLSCFSVSKVLMNNKRLFEKRPIKSKKYKNEQCHHYTNNLGEQSTKVTLKEDVLLL